MQINPLSINQPPRFGHHLRAVFHLSSFMHAVDRRVVNPMTTWRLDGQNHLQSGTGLLPLPKLVLLFSLSGHVCCPGSPLVPPPSSELVLCLGRFLNNNQLSGTLPSSWSTMTALNWLYVFPPRKASPTDLLMCTCNNHQRQLVWRHCHQLVHPATCGACIL
jgi:hypothetical protein